ncbi:RimK family alpha-L-glutamate ligase [Clostridium sp.]|uniref:RimK family alpha-L-glutamate ligase n=1 Tax=Clostridium sp. TaxID=1506 RepID=UPI0026061FA1|nr:RimK family alpha-L-glutamate ligase [Clostridium sp.]
MIGWIIYSGTLKIKKIEDLVDNLVEVSRDFNIDLIKVKNTEIIPHYNKNGEAKIKTNKILKKPEFVIFWDKDIYLAKHLENMGYRLFNNSKAIDNCDDKGLMHLTLGNKGIKMPKTYLSPMIFYTENIENNYLNSIFNDLKENVIIKESKGSFGMQVYNIKEEKAFINKIKELNEKGVRFIIQENIKSSYGRDIRVNIVGNKIIGAMTRESKVDFRANISQGGVGTLYKLNKEQEEMSLKATKALGLDFSGVDLLFGEKDEVILCEVNSNLNYLSFEKIWGKSFGEEIIKYIIEELK